MKILTIIGARPQFIKASMVSRALRTQRGVRERILHTGQHYDRRMSKLFFEELGIPKPYKNLGAAGRGRHAEQTAKIMVGIERECLGDRPDGMLIYGDTNSTLAGALVAAKLQIPLAHVEAGLRSFNREMPEEINRVVSDRLSQLLFAPTNTAVRNLRAEGIRKGVYRTGDVMIDAIYHFRERANRLSRVRTQKIVPDEPYFVLTLHRQENTDDFRRLRGIFRALGASPYPFIFPIHPRTRKVIRRHRIAIPDTIHMRDSLSYLEMTLLQSRAEAVWTDSGGMQKESVVLGKPCFTLRTETEWVETVRHGWNRVVGVDPSRIRSALKGFVRRRKRAPFPTARYYGNGKAAEKIAQLLSSTR